MARKTKEHTHSEYSLASILEVLSRQATPLSISQIMQHLKIAIPRRTLQRGLNNLSHQGLVKIIGRSRNTCYQIISNESAAFPQENGREIDFIRNYIRQPFSERKAVGYNSEFLERYQPNTTFYLTAAQRQQLQTMGKVSEGESIAGTFARQIFNYLLIDLSWNSSRLEGNTYSLLETENLIVKGEIDTNKTPIETQMILNHKVAIEFLVSNAGDIGFNRYTILNLHALLADNLLKNPAACGQLRNIGVGIGQSVYHPIAIPQKINDYFDLFLEKANGIVDAFEQAFFTMVHLPYLQPFEDVNKRVSRLAANIPLIKHDLCPLSFIGMPEQEYIDGLLGVYELNRIELLRNVFISAYEHSVLRYKSVRNQIGEPDPFRLKYRTFLKEAINTIVTRSFNPAAAEAWLDSVIKQKIAPEDLLLFKNIVATELKTLHEGNIARYHVRPEALRVWQACWESR